MIAKRRLHMKKVLILSVLSLLLFNVGSVFSEPFLVSDPQTDANRFRMRLSTDGTTWGAWVEGSPVNNALRFDLGPMAAGSYQGQAQAGFATSVTDSTTGQVSTVSTWSDSSPFVLRVPNKNKPTKIIISPN
jgi:hypothetical protein